jgi:hypothetical protein
MTSDSVHAVSFTPVESFIGGALLGVAISANLVLFGRVTGFSGIASEMIRPSAATFHSTPEKTWRLLFIAGIVAAGFAASISDPLFPTPLELSMQTFALAGLAVGFGTRLGNGCTSGHGICGLSRFSIRSLVGTCCFMFSGVLTAIAGRSWSIGGYIGYDDDSAEWRLAPVSWPPTLAFPLGACGVVAILLVVTVLGAQRARDEGSSGALQLWFAAVYVVIGAAAGLGLAVSGMLNQAKVLGFLDVAGGRPGGWDPSLAFVMGGGLAVSLATHAWARQLGAAPLLRKLAPFYFCELSKPGAPPASWQDPKLIVGSLVFGVGWGTGGVCPGPAITGLVFPFVSASGGGSPGCVPSGAGFFVWAVAFALGVWVADAAKATVFAAGAWQVLSVVDPAQCGSPTGSPRQVSPLESTYGATVDERGADLEKNATRSPISVANETTALANN